MTSAGKAALLCGLSRRWRWPRRALLGCVIVAAVWWSAVLVGDYPMSALDRSSATSLIVNDANGLLLRQEATSAGLRESWANIEHISPHLVHATLASEDHRFYDHGGIDWTALARASWLNLSGGKLSFGGSTITMQLVRLTAHTRRSLSGKLRQMVLAARLERRLSKRDILEQYLNRVYYGNGAWGAEQAARIYFGKSAHELSVGEATTLAVLPRGPTYYDPLEHWSRVEERRSHILALMEKRGYLSAEERALAERTPVELRMRRRGFRAPHFVELVKERLPEGIRRGASVTTTLDWGLQRRLEVAVDNHVARLEARNLTQAAVVVLRNSDGAILAMVGSRSYGDDSNNGAFNGATARLRPGSTLKPFVYAAAMERGDSAATIAYDVVLPKDAHQFYSKDVKSHGFARYREALAGSYNLSAVHTLQRVGVKKVLSKLRAAGLETLDKSDDEYDWGLAIGHAEVRLLDLTAAFSTFGRGGRPVEPRAVEEARAPTGEKWTEPTRVRERIFSEEIAYILFDILSDPDARKPMFGDRVPMNLPFKVALKTGTTKAYTDLWALGTTREYTVGVWAGNFDGSPTHQVMSVQGATPLLRAAFTAVAARYGEPTAPDRPSGIVSADVCPLSGKRPGPLCEHRKRELFLAGQEPTHGCDWHQERCGQRAIVYPKELERWALSVGHWQEPACSTSTGDGQVRILSPVDGSHFVLEPHRPAASQRPLLSAHPDSDDLSWTIDGVPAQDWLPTPGEHTIAVAREGMSARVSITYE